MGRWDDFDETTPPPLGTLRDVAARNHCTVQEAAKMMHLPTAPVSPPKAVPLWQIDVGQGFVFQDIRFKKTGEHTGQAIEDCYGLEPPLGHYEAWFQKDAKVLPWHPD